MLIASVLHQLCCRLRLCKSLYKNISPDAERLRLRLTARRSPSLGHLSCICSAFAVAPPLKCHALKRCTFWRETCLASVIALRLVNQRARAANQRARTANRLRSDICLSSALHALPLCTRCDKDIIIQINELDNQFERIFFVPQRSHTKKTLFVRHFYRTLRVSLIS